MNTITMQTILAALPSRAVAVLRDCNHGADDAVWHLCHCYAMLPSVPRGTSFEGADMNRILGEFIRDYCGEDGEINWEKVLAQAGTGVKVPANHTPEPWIQEATYQGALSDRWREFPIKISGEKFDVCLLFGDGTKNRGVTAANAARIVACANAMQGVASPAAELAQLRRKVAAAEVMASALGNTRVWLLAPDLGEESLQLVDNRAKAALAAWQEASK